MRWDGTGRGSPPAPPGGNFAGCRRSGPPWPGAVPAGGSGRGRSVGVGKFAGSGEPRSRAEPSRGPGAVRGTVPARGGRRGAVPAGAVRAAGPGTEPCSRRGFVLAPAPGPPCVPPCCSPLRLGKSLCAIMGSTQESRLENRSEGCLAKTHRSRGVRHRSSWEKVVLALFSVALPLGSRRTFGRVSGSQTPPLGIAKLLGKFFVCNNCRQREREEQNAPRRACSFPSE